MMLGLADVRPVPHQRRTTILELLSSQLGPVDSPAVRSLTSDEPHQLSISGRSVQHDEAASPSEPPKLQNIISYTPSPRASRAPTPDTYKLKGSS